MRRTMVAAAIAAAWGLAPVRAAADDVKDELRHRVQDVAVEGTIAYAATEIGLVTWDLSDPAGPVRLAELEIPGSSQAVTVEGGLAFVGAGPVGLVIADVRDPRRPRQVARLDTPGAAGQVALHGTLAAVADGTLGTALVDVRTPAKPVEVGRLDTGDYARGVAFAGGTRLLTAEDRDGLKVWDVANPKRPKLVARVAIPGTARAVRLCRGAVFVAGGAGGLSSVTLPARGALPKPTTVATGDGARGLACLDDRFLLVADGISGWKVFDAAKPAAPRLVATVTGSESPATRITVVGTLALVAWDYSGFEVYDVRDPAHPRRLDKPR